MKILFWTLCALVAYAYAGYPIVIWILARLGARTYRTDDAYEPSVTLLIPAYNEEKVIARKIQNALALEYPPDRLEIIVASESDDGTDEEAARYVGRVGPSVKLLASSIRRGKVANLHRAVPYATGEILIFTDANAMFRPAALRKLVRNFADPRVGSVSGRLIYKVHEDAPSAAAEEAYWDFEMMVKRASSALGSLPGANGSLFALRRDLYRPITERRGDDFELPIRVIIGGHASILEEEAISEETASERYIDEYRRKVRIINWMLVSAVILLRESIAARRWLIAFQLVSHKINRWAVPVWLLALLPLSFSLALKGGVYQAALAAQVLIYILALTGLIADRVGSRVPRLLGYPLYFVVVNWAALIGIVTCLAGLEVKWHKRSDRVT